MSWREKIADWKQRIFGGKAAPMREKMEELGIFTIGDERLDLRQMQLKDLHQYVWEPVQGDSPTEKVRNLYDKLRKVDEMVREIAIPWHRAGTDPHRAEMLMWWERLSSRANEYIRVVGLIIQRPDYIEKEDLVRKLEGYIRTEISRLALLITNVSYQAQDVVPSYNIVVQQLAPMEEKKVLLGAE